MLGMRRKEGVSLMLILGVRKDKPEERATALHTAHTVNKQAQQLRERGLFS